MRCYDPEPNRSNTKADEYKARQSMTPRVDTISDFQTRALLSILACVSHCLPLRKPFILLHNTSRQGMLESSQHSIKPRHHSVPSVNCLPTAKQACMLQPPASSHGLKIHLNTSLLILCLRETMTTLSLSPPSRATTRACCQSTHRCRSRGCDRGAVVRDLLARGNDC